MEDPTLFNQYPMDCFACSPDDFDLLQSFSTPSPPEINPSSYNQCFNYETTPEFIPSDHSVPSANPTSDTILPMPNSSSPFPIPSSSQLISFDHHFKSTALLSQGSYEYNIFSTSQFSTSCRNPTQSQEHIIAERKRRENLSQNFIALSAMLPGLKRMDRGSVLGCAIKYVKQLQEEVQTLEEQTAQKGIGSAALVKKSVPAFINDGGSTASDQIVYRPLPEIRVRISGEDILIKILCVKHSGSEALILGKLKKHDHLNVHTCSFLPFGNSIMDVTIMAKMIEKNCMTAKDMVRSLQQALRQII